jgi:hypothetical protein
MESFVNVQAAANMSSVTNTILSPVVTAETGMSHTWRIRKYLASAKTLMMKKTAVGSVIELFLAIHLENRKGM